MHRRKAIATLAGSVPLGALLACERSEGSAASAEPTPPPRREPGFAPRFFTREQALGVEDLAERLIPEGETPGARSAGVARLLDDILADVQEPEEQRRFVDGLAELDRQATAAHGKPFRECSANEQTALATALATAAAGTPPRAFNDPAPPPFWSTFRRLAISAFCNSRLGATRVLAYEDVPGDYQGCIPLTRAGKTWATR